MRPSIYARMPYDQAVARRRAALWSAAARVVAAGLQQRQLPPGPRPPLAHKTYRYVLWQGNPPQAHHLNA